MNAELCIERQDDVVFATFNRPEVKNALNAAVTDGLQALARELQTDRAARALVLRGAGGTFCAGGDIKEFGRLLMSPDPAPGEPDPAVHANRQFGDLLLAIDALPQVVISVVEGAAFGGAMGLVSVSDVTIAAGNAKFSLSETTIGLIPAQIGPFVVRKIGLYAARRLAVTGARFGADEAVRIGFVDQVVQADEIETALARTLDDVLRCEPEAVAATKALFNHAAATIAPDLLDDAARRFASALRGAGRRGASAFAAKSPAPWTVVRGTRGSPRS